jgi:hypothetical protein
LIWNSGGDIAAMQQEGEKANASNGLTLHDAGA